MYFLYSTVSFHFCYYYYCYYFMDSMVVAEVDIVDLSAGHSLHSVN